MADAAWYADPDVPGGLRYFDGTQWTEHRQVAPAVAPAGGAIVHVGIGKDGGTSLVATADRITIRGEVFTLAEIEGIQYSAVRQRLNGAYMGTHFTVTLRAGDRKQAFPMSTNHKDERLEEFSTAYGRLVALLDGSVCERLAADLAARITAGETVTLGPAGARVELAAAGFRLKKPLAKVVPWERVVDTEVEGGRVFFLVEKQPGAAPKRHSMVGLEGENMVVLPRLVRRLSPSR